MKNNCSRGLRSFLGGASGEDKTPRVLISCQHTSLRGRSQEFKHLRDGRLLRRRGRDRRLLRSRRRRHSDRGLLVHTGLEPPGAFPVPFSSRRFSRVRCLPRPPAFAKCYSERS